MLQSERAKRGETREYLHYYKLQQKQSLTATKKEAGKITASGRIHTKGQVAGMTHMQWATVRLRGRLPPAPSEPAHYIPWSDCREETCL